MKVTCSDCSNSWDMADSDLPKDKSSFDTVCPACGSTVGVELEQGGDKGSGDQIQWFVVVGRERKGPFDTAAVLKMISGGELSSTGFVWRQGFEAWKKAGEVEEFAQAFGGGQGGEPGMVWQRRETSVLFSLDDYKQRKATRSQGSVKEADVVDVRSLEEEPAAASRGSAAAGMISFDEAEVQRVAEALARKKKTKAGVTGLLIGLIIVIVVGAGAFVAWQLMKNKNIVGGPKLPPATELTPGQATQPAQPVQPDQAAQPAQPDQAAQPAQPDQAAQPAQAEPATQVAEKAVPKKTEPVAVKKPAVDAKPTTTTAPKQEQAETKPTTTTTVKKPDPVASANDADALLAQLNAGRKKDPTATKTASSSDTSSNLPEKLTVSQVVKGFNSKKGAMDSCVRSNGDPIPYTAKANVEIEGSGRVVSVKLTNAGAARACLEGVIRAISFDKFSGPNMKFPYTINVR